MNVTKANQPIGDAERERAFRRWQDRRIEELSHDPELRADFEDDVRRHEQGLGPSGRRIMPDELGRLTRGDNS